MEKRLIGSGGYCFLLPEREYRVPWWAPSFLAHRMETSLRYMFPELAKYPRATTRRTVFCVALPFGFRMAVSCAQSNKGFWKVVRR